MLRALAVAAPVDTVWFGQHSGRETILKENGFAVTNSINRLLHLPKSTGFGTLSDSDTVWFACPWAALALLGHNWLSLQKSSPWGHVLLPRRVHGLPSLVARYLLAISPSKAVLLNSLGVCPVLLRFEQETVSFNSFWEQQMHLCVLSLNTQAAELKRRHWSVRTVEIAFRKQIRVSGW